jgi:hypothetical protein
MKLVLEDRSHDQIVSVVGCSRRDVSVVKKAITARGITSEQDEAFTEAEVAELFPDGRRNVSEAYDQLSPPTTSTIRCPTSLPDRSCRYG